VKKHADTRALSDQKQEAPEANDQEFVFLPGRRIFVHDHDLKDPDFCGIIKRVYKQLRERRTFL
jgi:hypothetical protein